MIGSNTSVKMRLAVCTFGLAGLLISGSSLMAQDAPPAGSPPPAGQMGPGGDRMLDRMQKMLNLTPDQATKIKATQDDTRQQMMALHQSEQDKIRAVLNDDQKAKYDKMQQRMMERGQRGRGGSMAPPDSGTTAPPQ